MDILRSHTAKFEEKPYQTASVSSVCMHAGSLIGDQTTGSFIAELAFPARGETEAEVARDTYWITGSSAPCLSLFKPWWMIEPDYLSFSEDETAEAVAYWEQQEKIYRSVLKQLIDWKEYQSERDQIEEALLSAVRALAANTPDGMLAEIQARALEAETELRNKVREEVRENPLEYDYKGKPYFRRYWEKKNRKLEQGV